MSIYEFAKESNSVLAQSLHYVSLGYKVLPVHGLINGICTCGKNDCHKGKHPRTPNGVKDASTDEKTIRTWFADASWSNIAIAPSDGMFVLDIDPRNGGDEQKLIETHGAFPLTPTAKTGGGGKHYFFRLPTDMSIREKSGERVGQGIDIKTVGGYVVESPSLHESGHRYEWLVPIETPIAEAPAWLLECIASVKPTDVIPAKGRNSINGLTLTKVLAAPCDFASHPGANEGDRNNTLMRLLGVHLSRHDSEQTVESMAIAWGERCNPPMSQRDIVKRLCWAKGKGLGDGNELINSFLPDCTMQKHTASFVEAGESEKTDAFAKDDANRINSFFLPCKSESIIEGHDQELINSFLPDCKSKSESISKSLDPKPQHLSKQKHTASFVEAKTLSLAGSVNGIETANESANMKKLSESVKVLRKTTDTYYANISVPLRGEGTGSVIGKETDNESESKTVFDTVFDTVFEDDIEDEIETVVVMHNDAFYGLAGEIVNAIESETEADVAGVLLTLLVAFGNAVGNGPHHEAMHGKHNANLFAVVVGSTASAKGQSWSIVIPRAEQFETLPILPILILHNPDGKDVNSRLSHRKDGHDGLASYSTHPRTTTNC